MAALRDIKNKIAGVKKTRQITRAMNMVAAAKSRIVQEKTANFRPYAEKFDQLLQSLAAGIDPASHPLLAIPAEVRTVAVIQLSADRGLCGSFNSNLIQMGERLMREERAKGREIRLHAVGRKARDYHRRRGTSLATELPGAMTVVDFDLAVALARLALDDFLSGAAQEVHLVYSRFQGVASQVPTAERILPIQAQAAPDGAAPAGPDFLYEPLAGQILADLLPRYLNVRIYRALLETSSSEHAARMAAMDNATKACKDIIDNLTLAFNKARQAAITTELMDIVGGAEALKAS